MVFKKIYIICGVTVRVELWSVFMLRLIVWSLNVINLKDFYCGIDVNILFKSLILFSLLFLRIKTLVRLSYITLTSTPQRRYRPPLRYTSIIALTGPTWERHSSGGLYQRRETSSALNSNLQSRLISELRMQKHVINMISKLRTEEYFVRKILVGINRIKWQDIIHLYPFISE